MTTPLNKSNSYYQHIHEVSKGTYQFVVTENTHRLIKSDYYPSIDKCNEACTLRLYELHGLSEVDTSQVQVDSLTELLSIFDKEIPIKKRKCLNK